MRRINFLSLLILALASFSWGMITVEQAMQNIRQFESTPSLKLRYVGLDHELSWEETGGESPALPWPCYFIETDYPDYLYDRCYAVDPYTGQIVLWVDRKVRGATREYDRQMGYRSLEDMVTPQQAYLTAVNFIQSHNSDFDPAQYQILFSRARKTETGGILWEVVPYEPNKFWEVYGPSISFVFRKVIEVSKGSTLPLPGDKYCLELDSETGEVFKYTRLNFPLNVSLIPQISRGQAEQIALGVFNSPPFYPSVSYAEVVNAKRGLRWVNVPPNCFALIWSIDVNTYSDNESYQDELGSPDDPQGWKVTIDAHTGEVYYVDFYLGAVGMGIKPTKEKLERFKKAPKVKVPVRIIKDGTPILIPLRVLDGKFYLESKQTWFFAVKVEEKGKEIVLKYKVKELKLSLKDIAWKGGKVYIPLYNVLKIAGYSWRYVPREHAIYIEKVEGNKAKIRSAIGEVPPSWLSDM